MAKKSKATPKIPLTPPRPVAQSAVDWYKAKYPVDGAADIERWQNTGEIVIVDKIDDRYVWQEPVCQRCKRCIPRDANYCPYCARPVSSMPAETATTPLRRTQADIDHYIHDLGVSPEIIERMKADRDFVIVDKIGGNHDENNHIKN